MLTEDMIEIPIPECMREEGF